MRKAVHTFLAAGLIGLGAFAFVPVAHGQATDDRTTAQKTGDAIGNAADKTGEAAKKAVDKSEQVVGLASSDNP